MNTTNRPSPAKGGEQPESRGTKIAAEIRARANSYSDVKRERLLKLGESIIYGGKDSVKKTATRRP